MSKLKKVISLRDMEEMLRQGALVLPPLTIHSVRLRVAGFDALLKIRCKPWGKESTRFAVVMKDLSTPKAFDAVLNRFKTAQLPPDTLPMVILPYLREPQLERLTKDGISGIDLCGNGVVIDPGKMFVWRTGFANAFKSSVPIKNVYRKNSSLVPRVFFVRPRFAKVSDVLREVNTRNTLVSQFGWRPMAMSTVSKVLKTMVEDLLVSRGAGSIALLQPDELLDRLVARFDNRCEPSHRVRISLELADLPERLARLSRQLELPVVATGLGSVARYAVMQRGEILSVYCPRPEKVVAELSVVGTDQFANLELYPSEDETDYFDSRVDPATGFSWASPLQTYLELMRGDKRDQETAAQIRENLSQKVTS